MLTQLLFTIVVAWGADKPQVSATFSSDRVRTGDVVQLTISVKSEDEVQIEPPVFSNPANVQNEGMQTQTSIQSHLRPGPQGMEFEKKRSVDFIYTLRPLKPGKIRVGPFRIKLDGQNYELEPVFFQSATDVPPAPRRQGFGGILPPGLDDEDDSLFGQMLRRQRLEEDNMPSRELPVNEKEAFFILVETDKKEAFEGEQVFASWYLYTRGNIHQFDRLKFPGLRGFWKEDVEPAPALNFEKEKINGVIFQRALLASYALFPIKQGEVTIDEYKVRALISLPSESIGGFAFSQPYSYTRSSKPQKITVKPLPLEGRPDNFSGAVGNFTVRASVDNQNFIQGQPFTLKLRFDGDGNAKLIELPKLEWPTSFELYDSKAESRFFQSGKSFKEFSLLVIPRESGVLRIPPFVFSFFDPSTATYKTIQTQEIALQVAPGQAQSGEVQRLQLEKKPKVEETPVLPKSLLPQQHRNWQWLSGLPLLLFWTGLYSILFLVFIFGHWLWLKKLYHRRRLTDELRDRRQRWEKALKSQHWTLAATEVINAVYFVLSRLVEEGGLTRDLNHLLDQLPPSIRGAISESLRKELEVMQTVAFAPEAAWKALAQEKEFRNHTDKAFEILDQALRMADEDSAVIAG